MRFLPSRNLSAEQCLYQLILGEDLLEAYARGCRRHTNEIGTARSGRRLNRQGQTNVLEQRLQFFGAEIGESPGLQLVQRDAREARGGSQFGLRQAAGKACPADFMADFLKSHARLEC